ncbi:MAG TPA: hypothetical protein VG897_06835 [Terriglobales bacterium]|nr:hypothetical protein [Terriglobales bacterium]
MKVFGKISAVAFALMMSLNLFAAQKSVTVYTDSTLNGQKVAAGDYKVDYEINGSTAQVKFLQNNKAVASATGQVIEQDSAPSESTVIRSSNADGTSSIVELQLAKQKSAIRFAPEGSDKGN